MDLQDLLKGGAGGDVEEDHKGVTLLDPRILGQEVFAPCAVPDLHLYILVIMLEEADSVLGFECLPVVPTGEIVSDDSVEQLGLARPGQPLQQDLEGVLALSPQAVGSSCIICGCG